MQVLKSGRTQVEEPQPLCSWKARAQTLRGIGLAPALCKAQESTQTYMG